MSSEAMNVWRYIQSMYDPDGTPVIVSIKDLGNAASIQEWVVVDILKELKEINKLSYKIENNSYLRIEIKEENGNEVSGSNRVELLQSMEASETIRALESPEPIDGLYYINSEFLEELQESQNPQRLGEARLQYNRLSGNIRDILYVVGHDQVIAHDELLSCIISGIDKKIYFRDNSKEMEECWMVIPTRAFFITGNGGVGKTTMLVMAALYMANHTDTNVYIAQFKGNNSEDFAKGIIKEIKKRQDSILFIDNPYDNMDAVKYLIQYVRTHNNIRIVFSERHNRLELIFKDAALMSSIVNIAGAIVIKNQEQTGKASPEVCSLRFVREENKSEFVLTKEWKKKVVERMVFSILPDNMKLDDERLQRILENANYKTSPCEILLQVCLKYNREVEEEALETKIPFQFDWDEWKRIFSAGAEYALRAEGISLENVFPFIAALGLYKVPVTVRFIANLVRLNELELKSYFDEKLNGTEPVCYDGKFLSLKHDVIADLYFQAHSREYAPQYYLLEAINYLDEDLIINYERYVLSSKIIRGKREIPHNSIDTIALLKDFEQHESYIQCLKDNKRFYSYRHAKLYVMTQENHSNEEEFQNEWAILLQEVPNEGKIQLATWINCFTICMEMKLFPPDSFFLVIDFIDYRVVTDHMSNFRKYVSSRGLDIFLYRRIARKTYQTIVDRYEEDIVAGLELAEIMIEQSAVEDAENLLKKILDKDNKDKYKICVKYATLCKERYMRLDKKITKKEKWCKDNSEEHSNCQKSDDRNFPDRQNEEKVSDPGNIVIVNSGEEKSRKPSIYQQRKYYLESAEQYYRLAVEWTPNSQDARPFCALAGFLQTTAGVRYIVGKKNNTGNYKIGRDRIKEAEEYFLKAIEIGGNDYSAYNGLAMLYAHVQKWNPCFNPMEAERCYEKAIETCPKNMRVSCYVPWGNLNYNIGKFEEAREKYNAALEYKPDEKKAYKALELIEEEQRMLDQLLQEEPLKINNFNQLYLEKRKTFSCKKVQGKKRKNNKYVRWVKVLNKDLFKEETTQREILHLVYSTLQSEELTPDMIKNCKNAMDNLSNTGGVNEKTKEIGILYLRIAQQLHIRCEQNNEAPFLNLGRQKTFAHTIVKRLKAEL